MLRICNIPASGWVSWRKGRF